MMQIKTVESVARTLHEWPEVATATHKMFFGEWSIFIDPTLGTFAW